MNRSLVLKRETLTALTTDELSNVAGGDTTTHQPTPPQYVVTYRCTNTNVVCTGGTTWNTSCYC